MRKNLVVTTESLGKMLAEYLVIQGWAEENRDGSITLNETGMEKLAGPPYFFYLRDEDSPDEVNQVEIASNAATFTWYQKNFSPGKFRSKVDDNKMQVQQDLNNWKPGLISTGREQSWTPPPQQYQQKSYGGQQQHKKFYQKHSNNQQGGKKFFQKHPNQGQFQQKGQFVPKGQQGGGSPIKLNHNVPQIAKPQHFKNNKFKK